MSEHTEIEETKENLAECLQQVIDLLGKHKLVEDLVHRQEHDTPRQDIVEGLVHKQHLNALQVLLNDLHSADIAYILESLPLEERLKVWDLVKTDRDGDILLETSDAVRQTLIAGTDNEELIEAATYLDTDELADLVPDLPEDVLQELMDNLDAQHRERLQSALSYDDEAIGALMDFDVVTVREDISLEVAMRYLRQQSKLPAQTDKLFVVDREDILQGVLPLKRLVVHDLDLIVSDIMIEDAVIFNPDDLTEDVAQAFERYDLVTAPVVDANRKLIGRVTVDEIMDYIREESEADILSMVGLREDEDYFASIWASIRNRWAWLAVNLVTALVASRVIGMFEDSIEKIVALAALMPIVAGIGGNSGNQTTTMIVRGLALGQIATHNAKDLIQKELGIALFSGLFWGAVLGAIAYILYGNVDLGIIMMAAMTLNLLLAAVMGVMIPFVMNKFGRDPAVGSSVLITAMTDSGGFLIFLGLATVFLL